MDIPSSVHSHSDSSSVLHDSEYSHTRPNVIHTYLWIVAMRYILWGAVRDICIFMHYKRREVKNKVGYLIY